MKIFVTLVFVVMLSAFASIAQAVIAFEAGFETLPTGSMPVGDASNLVDGRWRSPGTAYPDPTVVNTVARTGTQSLQISRQPAGQAALGWTTAGAVPAGTIFDFVTYINRAAGGSWTMAVNNLSTVQSNQDVSLLITATGRINGREYRSGGDHIWRDTGAIAPVGVWTGIKMSITSLGDGTNTVAGRGFYDMYADFGSGWSLIRSAVGFDSSLLQSGANAVHIQPGAPAGALSGYIDDVEISYVPEPVTLLLLGVGGLIAAKRRRN